MSDGVTYDVIVVGAGVEGSSTAWQLNTRQAGNVLLLEQFPLPHTRGSSHGATRIIRKAYPIEVYAQMMNYNMEAWKRIQRDAGISIYENTGFLHISHLEDKGLQDSIQCLKNINASFKVLSPDTFRQRFPQMKYDENVGAVHDLEGGILYADKCLQALQKLFVTNGGVLRDGEKVESLVPGDESVRVLTSKGTYTGRRVVLCCGPWTNRILKTVHLQLPLVIRKIGVFYWPERVPGSCSMKTMMPFAENMKTVVTYPYFTYGFPSNEYPGHLKFCLHRGPEIDPERRDAADNQWVIDLLKAYVRKHFPGLVPEPSIIEPCHYTDSPDEDFILDYHPQWSNIVIGAGFSGHGFKHGPAVGDILADLSLGRKPRYDISRFRIGRFDTATHSKL